MSTLFNTLYIQKNINTIEIITTDHLFLCKDCLSTRLIFDYICQQNPCFQSLILAQHKLR